ncbi:polysaccharide pyruvyl transferase [Pedobacter sp. HMF7647]|uniref:Polysaccharide pyruvyl transferase n=1 Tax=Hufsiella arboris TaxID=2695275 RepID=A0A7K1YC03_9SPHI|nr:polysaccharide pyruvyl transferase family protein [Hufsiella arboris]MXV52116.1 polysaccharide pyruvyl transferase [Hufsiella arboris]
MNTNKEHILKLRELIFNTLSPLINKDYCLLDIPDHVNIGDQLIAGGEFAFLQRIPHKMLYTSNDRLCQMEKIPVGSVILFHGGGNFGDLWRGFQEFRLDVIKRFPHNRIIILPQTVHYKDPEMLKQDAAEFSKHPDLTICVRDSRSFELMKEHFVHNKIFMLPDMAFNLDFDQYISMKDTGKALLLERVDQEIGKGFNPIEFANKVRNGKQIEIRDWPSIKKGTIEGKVKGALHRANGVLSKALINVPVIKEQIDHRYGFMSEDLAHDYAIKGINYINEYDVIYTTRLHGFILSVLLNKEVYMIDNSYGKNSTFFNAWMKDFEKVHLIQ